MTAWSISTFGEPKALFNRKELSNFGYEAESDGQRFLTGKVVGESKSTVNIVLNWTSTLKK